MKKLNSFVTKWEGAEWPSVLRRVLVDLEERPQKIALFLIFQKLNNYFLLTKVILNPSADCQV